MAKKTVTRKSNSKARKAAKPTARKTPARKTAPKKVTKRVAAAKATARPKSASRTSAAPHSTTVERKDLSYNPAAMEPKWQARWAQDKLYRAVIDPARPKHY